MDIVLKQNEEIGTRKLERIDISMNERSHITAMRSKERDLQCYLSIRSLHPNGKKYEIKECEISDLLKLIHEVSNHDTVDSVEKNVYVLPFASGIFNKLIGKLRELGQLIKEK